MTIKKLSMALAAALLALPMVAAAQDEEAAEEESSRLSWNLSLTSSYMFRGIDLTDDHPAIQGGLDFALDHGIYVGTWWSNLESGDSDAPDLEGDVYVGWSHDLNDDWNIDLMAARYSYFGERDAFGNHDYNEYFAKLSYQGMVTFTYAYTNDYFNDDATAQYFALSSSHEFGEYTFDTNLGLSTFDSWYAEDYVDWSLGVSRAFGPVTTSLMYTGTDSDGEAFAGEAADDKIVLTFSIGG